MKAYFTILVIIFSVFYCNAQTYEWDKTMFFSAGDQLAIMNNDHKIITGRFEGSMSYQGITLSTSLHYGAFIAKLDENDSLLWMRKFVESEHLHAFQNTPQFGNIDLLEVDNTNNFYLTLNFADSIFVDSQLYIANITNPEYRQSLLLKFDSNGNIVQDFYFDGNCWKGIIGIHVDSKQNLYIYGGYGNDNFWTTASCTCIFDGTSHTTSSTDVFLAKYDSLGSLLWINNFEANNNIYPRGFGISGNSIYLSGSSYNSNIPIDFGSFTLSYPSNYDKGGFMAKYDTDGTFKWAKYYGAKGWDSNVSSYDIEILNNNTIVVGGFVQTQSESSHLYFQNSSALTRNSLGAEFNYFLIAYDSLGNIKWKDLAQCSGWDGIYAMSSDSKSNLYVTGYYNNSLHFGNTTLPNAGDDLFVAAFDSNGINLWAKQAGENGGTYALDIEVDSEDNIYVNGYTYSNPIVFGDTSYLINTSPSVFIAKMTPSLVSSTTNILAPNPNKKLLKVVDVLGRETHPNKNVPLFYIYDDGTVEKRIVIE
jgi:hypothetical protein